MKSLILRLFLYIFFIALLSNCTKDKIIEHPCFHHEIAKLIFTESDLSIIPYTGNETLIFKDTLGDSIVFSNGLKNSIFYVNYQYDWHEAQVYNNGCRGDYITSEQYFLTFHAITGSGYFGIDLFNRYSFDMPGNNNKVINLTIQPFNIFDVVFAGSYKFSHDTIFNLPNSLDSIVSYNSHLTIGPKTFSDVYELYSSYIPNDSSEWYNRAYYSKIDGLVGLRTNFGRLLYLASKR